MICPFILSVTVWNRCGFFVGFLQLLSSSLVSCSTRETPGNPEKSSRCLPYSLPAKAQGAKTKLIGLTWIDEAQSILVKPGSDIRSPEQLVGKRLALPAYRQADIDIE